MVGLVVNPRGAPAPRAMQGDARRATAITGRESGKVGASARAISVAGCPRAPRSWPRRGGVDSCIAGLAGSRVAEFDGAGDAQSPGQCRVKGVSPLLAARP
ncbi:hypothetical protein DSL92_06385 [Billgrantia gudaonensis]|uniref:Uncharacterized protein n=1 Tax=Billgrantia gudaonensis TaxID=376427 RepID=A0A3S0NDV6_9GAMM|nr:hypothetical protein DSL92_06385 [Halomonas gudaonensis]